MKNIINFFLTICVAVFFSAHANAKTKVSLWSESAAEPQFSALNQIVADFNASQDEIEVEHTAYENTPYEKIYIVRSLVATREIGFLPGDHEDKSDIYQVPYKNMVKYMFQMSSDADFEMLYGNLKAQETIKFWSTSFLRGTTLDRSIVIVDEFQNLNFHELDSIMTRVGEDSKIFFCGDASQTDLQKTNEKNGIVDFMKIIRSMPSFDVIEFGIDDIVRSGIVKEYLIAKLEMGM